MVQWLLKNGANVNIAWNNGVTPLWLVVYTKHIDVIEILLEYKPIIDYKIISIIKTLDVYMSLKDYIPSIITNTDHYDDDCDDDNNLLGYGTKMTFLTYAMAFGEEKLVDYLLENTKYDINYKIMDKYNILDIAYIYGKPDLISKLIAYGADYNNMFYKDRIDKKKLDDATKLKISKDM